MADTPSLPFLDHIVILVPQTFLTDPPSWFSDLFAFYPGGRHADGLTENTLVLLADGSYIEFIAFRPDTDPQRRQQHKWGSKREGNVIDWALSLEPKEGRGLDKQKALFENIQSRVARTETGVSYGNLVPGGRIRPDGQELRWAVASACLARGGADETIDPGQLPFWCLDDTPRNLRVPYHDLAVTNHPTGAVGVAFISITPRNLEEAQRLERVYDTVFGEDSLDSDSVWDMRTLSGADLHAESQLHLGPPHDTTRIKLALFTNIDQLAGTTVGGKVTEDTVFEIELVSALRDQI